MFCGDDEDAGDVRRVEEARVARRAAVGDASAKARLSDAVAALLRSATPEEREGLDAAADGCMGLSGGADEIGVLGVRSGLLA